MLYLFYGDDSVKKHSALDALTTAGTDGIFFASKGDDYDAIINEHAASASLFGEKSIIIFDDALADKDARALLLDRMEILAESENIFVFLEAKALKETLTAFTKAGAVINEFTQKKEKEFNKEINIFGLTDAFARK